MATLLPNGKQQFEDINGVPLVGGLVYFYIPNTTVFKNTYQDSGQTILNTNPVVLDSRGQAVIYGEGVYRQVLYDADGNLIWDQLTGSAAATLYAGSATGTADVIVLTLSPPLTDYIDGQIIEWKAIADNTTTTPTANVNTLGAKVITLQNGSPLYAGAIKSGGIYQIAYTATTDQFQLLGASSGTAGNENLGADVVDDGSGNLTAGELVLAKTDDYAIAAADRNKLVVFTISASKTATLPSAVTVGTKYRVKVMNLNASSVALSVAATAGTFSGGTLSAASGLTLLPGESAIFTSDGANWDVTCIVRKPASVRGSFKNLKIATADASTGPVVTADEITLEDSTGNSIRVSSVSVTAAIDTGAIASAKAYYIWVFYNPGTATVSARYSLSSTAPTAPAGSTYSARVGSAITKQGAATFLGSVQYGRKVQYLTPQNIANGTAGTVSGTAPTWAAVTVAANSGASTFVPLTASAISIIATTRYGNSSVQEVQVAPNNSYGGNSSTNPPPLDVTPGTTGGGQASISVSFTLESTSIYWTSGGAGGGINCLGWDDNL